MDLFIAIADSWGSPIIDLNYRFWPDDVCTSGNGNLTKDGSIRMKISNSILVRAATEHSLTPCIFADTNLLHLPRKVVC
jgi:hypothetical protein